MLRYDFLRHTPTDVSFRCYFRQLAAEPRRFSFDFATPLYTELAKARCRRQPLIFAAISSTMSPRQRCFHISGRRATRWPAEMVSACQLTLFYIERVHFDFAAAALPTPRMLIRRERPRRARRRH